MHKETYTNNPGKNLGKSPRGKPSIDLMCPDLPFVENGVLKIRKRLGRFVLRVLKIKKRFDFIALKSYRMS